MPPLLELPRLCRRWGPIRPEIVGVGAIKQILSQHEAAPGWRGGEWPTRGLSFGSGWMSVMARCQSRRHEPNMKSGKQDDKTSGWHGMYSTIKR